jgi:hypothetical protein
MNNYLQNLIGQYNMLTQNPMQMLSRKFNLPQGIDCNNPNEIINHLVNSGQVKQSDLDMITQMFKH